MSRRDFFEKILRHGFISSSDISTISQAYYLAKEVHRSQKRDGGERYFEHCRRVACLLMEYEPKKPEGLISAPAEIILALLHDCVEDGFIPADLLTKLFGPHITNAIDILSKVTPVFDERTGEVQKKIKKDIAEYYRAISESPPWIYRVKLADRLDTLNYETPLRSKIKDTPNNLSDDKVCGMICIDERKSIHA